MTRGLSPDKTFANPEHYRLAKAGLSAAKQVLEILTPFWLSCGTLLGCMRDHDLIAHDEDLDVCIWYDSALIPALVTRFEQRGFSKLFLNEGHLTVAVPESHEWDVHLDVWFVSEDGPNKTWFQLAKGGGYTRMVFPAVSKLVEVDFLGEKYPVPENWREHLTAQYGGWEVPVADYLYTDSTNFEKGPRRERDPLGKVL